MVTCALSILNIRQRWDVTIPLKNQSLVSWWYALTFFPLPLVDILDNFRFIFSVRFRIQFESTYLPIQFSRLKNNVSKLRYFKMTVSNLGNMSLVMCIH